MHRPQRRELPVFRSPGEGYVLPRLNRPKPADAIGMHHNFAEDDQDE